MAQPAKATTTTIDEARIIAGEMAKAHHGMVEHYRKAYELAAADAEEQAARVPEKVRERLKDAPADSLSWHDLNSLGAPDALAKWEDTKEAARAELRSGWRAAEAAEWVGATPWQRARFLALRESLAEEWQPRGGMEWVLIDMAAQAYTGWEVNLTMAVGRFTYECEYEREQYREKARYKSHDHVPNPEEAANAAERFQRMYVRAMRMLQNLRRYAPAITINQPRSVNIAAAGGQQVNVTEGAE